MYLSAPHTWHLASDKEGVDAGSAIHRHWINGWNETFSTAFVDHCLKGEQDCHANLLGDGMLLKHARECVCD